MDTTKLRRPVSLSLTPDEANILSKLNEDGISTIEVFRQGLRTYQEKYIDTMHQNNNA